MKLINVGKDVDTEYSYDSQLDAFTVCQKDLNVVCSSKTHLGRNVAARDAEHGGASKNSIERHGKVCRFLMLLLTMKGLGY